MMMGLTFYELWYSGIPEVFKWRDLDQFDRQENSHTEGTSFSNRVGHCQENSLTEGISFSSRVGQSEWHNSVESHMADSQYQCDSDSSVMNSGEIGNNKDMIDSMDVDANHRREKSHPIDGFSLTSDENPTQDILHHNLGKIFVF